MVQALNYRNIDSTTNDVQPSEQNQPNRIEGNAQTDHDVPMRETEQATILTTGYDREPGRRLQIWQLPPDEHGAARCFYISTNWSYQPALQPHEYNFTGTGAGSRLFHSDCFTNFFWLEYSPLTNCAYCLPCFLFLKKPIRKCGSHTSMVKVFDKWKKVNNGKECAFLTHMGTTPNLAHNFAARCFENLKNRMNHVG